jgi:hypothetical protein
MKVLFKHSNLHIPIGRDSEKVNIDADRQVLNFQKISEQTISRLQVSITLSRVHVLEHAYGSQMSSLKQIICHP